MDEIAVLIPCYNESKTIEKVVKDFRKRMQQGQSCAMSTSREREMSYGACSVRLTQSAIL